MNNNLISKIGAILYSLVMIMFGINHLKAGAAMAGYVPAFIPAGAHTFFVYFTGIALILAGIAIILNVKSRLAAYLLAVLLLLIALTLQLPPVLNGTDTSGSFFASLLKDMALAGAALFIGSKGK